MSSMSDRALLDEHSRNTMARVERYLAGGAVPELHEHSEPIQSFFLQLPLPAWLKRTDGSIYVSNPAYQRVHAANPEPNPGWAKEREEVFDATDAEALKNGSAFTIQSTPESASSPAARFLIFKYRMDVTTDEGAETMVAGISVLNWPSEWFGDKRFEGKRHGGRKAEGNPAGSAGGSS